MKLKNSVKGLGGGMGNPGLPRKPRLGADIPCCCLEGVSEGLREGATGKGHAVAPGREPEGQV